MIRQFIFSLHAKIIPVIVFLSITLCAAEQFKSFNSFCSGTPGKPGLPFNGWAKNWQKGSGITKAFTYEKHPVFRLISGEKTAVASTRLYEMPQNGKIRFSIWARATEKAAEATLFIVADDFQSYRSQNVFLSENFRKISVEFIIPAKISKSNTFFFRVDAPPGNNDFLIGKIEVEYFKIEDAEKKTGNLIYNGEFHFGTSGFLRRYESRVNEDKNIPQWNPGSLKISAPYFLSSHSLSYRPNTVYTAVVKMRRARKGIPTTAGVLLLPASYTGFVQKNFQLTDDFREYVVQGKMPPSRYNRMELRIDLRPGWGEAEIDRIQLVEGTTSTFLPPPLLEMGLTGPASFDYGQPDAALAIQLRQNGKPTTGKLKCRIRDIYGQIVRQMETNVTASSVSDLKLPVDTGKRGTYTAELEFRGEKQEIRFSVLKNFSGSVFPENALASHFKAWQNVDQSLFNRYCPVSPNVNRFFFPKKKDGINVWTDPELQQQYRNSKMRNVACLLWTQTHEFGFDTWLDNELTPELEKRLLEEIAEFAQNAVKCGFYGVELFNEPFLWVSRKGEKLGQHTMPAEKVAYLYKKAYPIIKKYAPDLKVIGPCSHLKEETFNRRFFEAGGAEGIDIFSYHSYNSDPDQERVAERSLALQCLAASYKPGLKLCNTEMYYGVRNHMQMTNDDEARRIYFKDSELSLASTYASMYANAVVASDPFCLYTDHWLIMGVPWTQQQLPLASAVALNAAIEFLGNSGQEKKIIPIDDALRCFLFPLAVGGPVATLRAPAIDKPVTTQLPEGVMAYDLFGNPLHNHRLTIGDALVYLRFAPGANAEKILKELDFEGLGSPFDIELSALNHRSLAIRVRNRTAKERELQLTLEHCPENWVPQVRTFREKLSPFEEKIVPIPMKKFTMHSSAPIPVIVKVVSGNYNNEFVRKLNVFPVRYSRNFKFQPDDYFFFGAENYSPLFENRPLRGDSDCSVRVAGLWNEQGLTLSAKVSDDRIIYPNNAGFAYQFDSLQIYFDMKRDGIDPRQQDKADNIIYNIGLLNGKKPFAYISFAEGTRYIGEGNKTTGYDDQVKVSVKPGTDCALEYTLFFPKETLYLVRFESGGRCGFSMLVNDNDGAGRKQGVTLTQPGSEPLDNPHLFKDMIFLQQKASSK
ncbi:sugar-binding protein [uncultured Victivallis sp.]|uniref:sugar-binding protein n=1 Tax=uncultured Victivallis sp. TaxID=354118 RepID=UPI0025E968D9|nr:sugar-binding protein [uncultured Victivallis sp.]